MVWNYPSADCSFKDKFIVLFAIILGTLTFPISNIVQRAYDTVHNKEWSWWGRRCEMADAAAAEARDKAQRRRNGGGDGGESIFSPPQ